MLTNHTPEDHTDRLTLSELKAIPGFEHIPDNAGTALLETLHIFCQLVVDIYTKNAKNTDNSVEFILQAA